MKKFLFNSAFILVCFSFNLYSQKQVPVEVQYKTIVFMDELDAHFYQAAINYINFNDAIAAENIRKAAYYFSSVNEQMITQSKDRYLKIGNQLFQLSEDLSNGKVMNIQKLAKEFAATHYELSSYFMELSNISFKEDNIFNCVIFLDAASTYLVLGAKWIGYEVGQGTRATRRSIDNLTQAIRTRNEINTTELKKVLDFMNKEINKYGNKVSGTK